MKQSHRENIKDSLENVRSAYLSEVWLEKKGYEVGFQGYEDIEVDGDKREAFVYKLVNIGEKLFLCNDDDFVDCYLEEDGEPVPVI